MHAPAEIAELIKWLIRTIGTDAAGHEQWQITLNGNGNSVEAVFRLVAHGIDETGNRVRVEKIVSREIPLRPTRPRESIRTRA